jgi:hypothetical protein
MERIANMPPVKDNEVPWPTTVAKLYIIVGALTEKKRILLSRSISHHGL